MILILLLKVRFGFWKNLSFDGVALPESLSPCRQFQPWPTELSTFSLLFLFDSGWRYQMLVELN